MTASESTPSEGQESTDDETDELHLFDREEARGHITGQVFIEPERAACEIERIKGERFVTVCLREATNSRGLKVSWLLPIEDAQEFVDDLDGELQEIE